MLLKLLVFRNVIGVEHAVHRHKLVVEIAERFSPFDPLYGDHDILKSSVGFYIEFPEQDVAVSIGNPLAVLAESIQDDRKGTRLRNRPEQSGFAHDRSPLLNLRDLISEADRHAQGESDDDADAKPPGFLDGFHEGLPRGSADTLLRR